MLDAGAQGRHVREIHVARRDLLRIEQIVDRVEQGPPRGMDPLQIYRARIVAFVAGILEEHLAVAEDGVDGSAQIMSLGSDKGFADNLVRAAHPRGRTSLRTSRNSSSWPKEPLRRIRDT